MTRRDRSSGPAPSRLQSRRRAAILREWPPSEKPSPGKRCSRPVATTTGWSTTTSIRRRPGAPSRSRPTSTGGHRRPPGGRNRAPLRASARGAGGRLCRADDRHHGHSLGEVTVLSAPDARGPDDRPDRARAVPVSDQGAGPGSGPRAAPLRTRQGDPAGHLRRGHPAGAASRDPQEEQPDPHQP